MTSSKWIHEVRNKQRLTSSDIEQISRQIAMSRGNPDYYISHSTLADMETGSIPSVYKLFSLATCLGFSLKELLRVFGIDSNEVSRFGEQREIGDTGGSRLKPGKRDIELNPGFDAGLISPETTLMREPQQLRALPLALRERLDPRRFRYAVIGSHDDTMWDLIPPQSFVEIDPAQNAVTPIDSTIMRARPVYLVRHIGGLTCCWCQQDGQELVLLPYPVSSQRIRRFKLHTESSVIGRVTNAWLPLKGSTQPKRKQKSCVYLRHELAQKPHPRESTLEIARKAVVREGRPS